MPSPRPRDADGPSEKRTPPLRLGISHLVIVLASRFVPRERRAEWRRQWDAELAHRWRVHQELPVRRIVLWSLGSFAHAWYLLRTEFSMLGLLQDFRYGFRSLRQSPGLIAVAVLSLALGIGANSTIFSAVDVFMLDPLPYEDADRVLALYTTNADRGWTRVSFSIPDFVDARDRSETTDIAAIYDVNVNLSGEEQPERLVGARVSSNFFSVLRVQPWLGRGFTRDEERAGGNRVAVIGNGLWHRRFAADSSVLGNPVLLDGEMFSIVGVMPADFWFQTGRTEVWIPLGVTGDERRGSRFVEVVGRVRGRASIDQAYVEIGRIGGQLAAAYPDANSGNGMRAGPLREQIYDPGYRTGSAVASVAVAFVLLIACANVANLLLTRAAGRGREVAVRGALGATRIRIARQFLAESVLVAGMGGVLGTAFAFAGIRGFRAILPPDMPRVEAIGLDMRVLGFTAAITLLTGIMFGLAPALQSAGANITDALKEGGRAGSGVRSGRLRQALVVSEVALSVTLLVSSALLVQGFRTLMSTELGFDTKDVLTFRVTLPRAVYPDTTAINAFHRTLEARLGGIPGVVTVGATTILPDRGNTATLYTLPGEQGDEGRERAVNFREIMPGYFQALDIPVQLGRGIQAHDRETTPRVVVINEAMASRHWPDENPVGKHIAFSGGTREIVGVVADARDFGPDAGSFPMLFFAAYQSDERSMSWLLETTALPETLAGEARAAVSAIDPHLPVFELMTMDAVIREETAVDRVMPSVMTVLAAIALVLALGGVYGVIAYAVSQRTREMGVRLALGASGGAVLTMVVRQGTRLALIGVALGVVLALAATRSLSIFLYGVSPFDPVTFVAVAAALTAAASAAAYVPARRATRVDPVAALKAE